MKILFFGDVYGQPGRSGLKKILPGLLEKFAPDFVLANAENLAHGRGPTEKQLGELAGVGIDGFTSGNHIGWNFGLTRQIWRVLVCRVALLICSTIRASPRLI